MSKFRRQLMMASMGEPVPSYDAQLEYLTFNENCVVSTGIYPCTDYVYAWRYYWESKAAWTYFFSNTVVANNWFMFGGTERVTQSHVHIKSSSKMGTAIALNTMYDCTLSHSGSYMAFIANNTTMAQVAYTSFTSPSLLNVINIRTSVVRLYSFTITDNGTLLRDFIPVRVGATGYLYDRVEGRLYGNTGTGAFTLGPDV